MDALIVLLVLLLLTRALGAAASRLGQAPSVGESLAGMVLAMVIAQAGDVVPLLGGLVGNSALSHIADAGIFFIVLLAGIEMNPREIAEHSAASFAVAAGGALVPLVAGCGLAWAILPDSDLKSAQTLLVGVAMSITAIPATVKVFAELNLLHSRIGETVVSAAIFDDVIGLVLLAILTAVIETGSIPDAGALIWLLVKVAALFAITVTLGVHVYPRLRRGLRALQIAALEFSTLMAVAIAYALLAQALGMHWILGAFLAGLYFEPSRVGWVAYNQMKLAVTGVTNGFLGPIYFALIGLHVDLAAFSDVPLLITLLIATAILGKLVGAGLPARWTGLGGRDALAVGLGMSARGAVELVVLGIARDAGVFARGGGADAVTAHLFSALVIMAVATTLITPILLRWLLSFRPRT